LALIHNISPILVAVMDLLARFSHNLQNIADNKPSILVVAR